MYNKKQKDYYQKYQSENKEKCREYNRLSYYKNKEKRLAHVKQYQTQAKIDVINYYSNGKNVCECCGVKGLIFLTIDHIKGDGAKKRKYENHKTGSMFYGGRN